MNNDEASHARDHELGMRRAITRRDFLRGIAFRRGFETAGFAIAQHTEAPQRTRVLHRLIPAIVGNAHTTRAERGEDFIRPEFGTCR